ncbi:hypothetical protein SAMN05443572_114108 [Myxococcus fulvus]|uniref:Immunity MXAN-0049 protein domain-containing protein n=1 Tax=Myxococcus fulvus TaxID=33 RepID=A0A511TAP6_MYXFU|nr:DUF1629 domain-containing protein [Myxococcus fulvus]AKF84451.1 hypothetical protein MFUL124B02_42965 [Myxococcus fulvus 124B02]GEN11259.1 hypothetical protein MFU01_62960 [Myxococcus fulvus]SEU39533.1 hypothetical protein SAMN05443572_114108 [Myxococcus fulvus]
MLRRFFELHDDVALPERWHLADPLGQEGPRPGDVWRYTEGLPVQVGRGLRIPVEVPGRPLDFSLAGMSVPVVHVRLAPVFLERAPGQVQLLPVGIEGQPEQYCILVATRLVDCLDEAASRVRRWEPEDGLPEKVGQYSSVRDLRVDAARVGDAVLFRVKGWPGPLIVSEDLKRALEDVKATGLQFLPV